MNLLQTLDLAPGTLLVAIGPAATVAGQEGAGAAPPLPPDESTVHVSAC
ncbi:hypothetical protein [Streptomyces sp. 900105245]